VPARRGAAATYHRRAGRPRRRRRPGCRAPTSPQPRCVGAASASVCPRSLSSGEAPAVRPPHPPTADGREPPGAGAGKGRGGRPGRRVPRGVGGGGVFSAVVVFFFSPFLLTLLVFLAPSRGQGSSRRDWLPGDRRAAGRGELLRWGCPPGRWSQPPAAAPRLELGGLGGFVRRFGLIKPGVGKVEVS